MNHRLGYLVEDQNTYLEKTNTQVWQKRTHRGGASAVLGRKQSRFMGGNIRNLWRYLSQSLQFSAGNTRKSWEVSAAAFFGAGGRTHSGFATCSLDHALLQQ